MDAYEFILEEIDTVPQLETLVLLWNSRPVGWTPEELASRLYVPAEQVVNLLKIMVRQGLVAEQSTSPPRYAYLPKSDEQDELMREVDNAYRRDLVRVSNMIHSKASPAVRDFARAFRIRKERG